MKKIKKTKITGGYFKHTWFYSVYFKKTNRGKITLIDVVASSNQLLIYEKD